jgi:hypothetical protein
MPVAELLIHMTLEPMGLLLAAMLTTIAAVSLTKNVAILCAHHLSQTRVSVIDMCPKCVFRAGLNG